MTTNGCGTVLRNPLYFVFLLVLGAGLYITYTLNLWGPIIHMTNAATQQGLEIGKQRLREFLESSDTGRQAMAMSASSGSRNESDGIKMDSLNKSGKKTESEDLDDI